MRRDTYAHQDHEVSVVVAGGGTRKSSHLISAALRCTVGAYEATNGRRRHPHHYATTVCSRSRRGCTWGSVSIGFDFSQRLLAPFEGGGFRDIHISADIFMDEPSKHIVCAWQVKCAHTSLLGSSAPGLEQEICSLSFRLIVCLSVCVFISLPLSFCLCPPVRLFCRSVSLSA